MRKRISSPVELPISLTEVKKHIRIDYNDEDDLLEIYLKAATEYAEQNLTYRAFMTQTWQVTIPSFQETIKLPYPPLQTVDSINYIDKNGDTQTVSESIYRVDSDIEPGCIYQEGEWPSDYKKDSIVITFTAGYPSQDDIPENFVLGLLLLTGHFYENREATTDQQLVELPFTVQAMFERVHTV
ncbi:head-tail connector protein [Alteribacillus sp. YIM 98480]|uniref:head-tail connector protein n=1 Tax=Alteribacillus sp. YIM 98480 TaxID=2606599 RepID=UPI00131E9AE8|nr:head-tail connector protein [Alteribacillus sp. YIM 98480]